MRDRRAWAVAVALGALGAGCATNPATGETQLSLIGEGQEVQMGQQYAREVDQQLGLYPDSSLQRYVAQVGARLAATSERPNIPWSFKVVDDPVVNAFALPGGPIYVTRGILAHLDNEAQLAAVLGHEIGHITARHSVSRMSTQQLAQLGLVVGAIVSPTVARYGQLASAGLGVLFLKYSRDDERQADDLGLRYLRRGGYDARRMPEIFTMLERASAASGGGRVPEWLATHPDPVNRRATMERAVAAIPADSVGGAVNADDYLRRLDGMVFGPNPREGFFRGSQFFHPDLRFRLVFPDGWQTENQRQGVVAASPQQDAAVQLSLAQEPTADAAARAFLARQGVQGTGARASINGLPAVSGTFTAQTDAGVMSGSIAFIEHRGSVFGLLAFAPEARWGAYQAVAERTLRSFEPVNDPAILNVQPLRLDLIRLDRATTIEAMARGRPAGVPVATLALINQVEPQTRLETGSVVKWVVGTAP